MKCIFKIQPVSERQVRKIVPDSGSRNAGRAAPDSQFKESLLMAHMNPTNLDEAMTRTLGLLSLQRKKTFIKRKYLDP